MEEYNLCDFSYIPYYILGILCILLIVLYFINKEDIHQEYNYNIFDTIYKNAEWGKGDINGGSSGHGSSPEINEMYISYLNEFIKKYNIHSIVDIGCGDWQIMNHIDLTNVDYKGFDVVDEVINENNKLHKSSSINFYKTNLNDIYDYPSANLLICKDVLQHLDYENINHILSKLDKYDHVIIINDFSDNTINHDISNGGYRELDLRTEPFNMSFDNLLLQWPSHESARKVLLHKIL